MHGQTEAGVQVASHALFATTPELHKHADSMTKPTADSNAVQRCQKQVAHNCHEVMVHSC